jgi:glycosyltransferase involved in cell wall biosynthesis
MTFTIITHVPHIMQGKQYFAYAPYVREMNIWIRQADKVIIVAPISAGPKTAIDYAYENENIEFLSIASVDLLNLKSLGRTICKIPKITMQIFKAMQEADHIHLRCPGNIGLLGCLVQILFPNTPKTAKYAGNWDPRSKQPWSYKLQQWILTNTFLSRNMQVLVYGEWAGSSKNIKPFFTATYTEADKLALSPKKVKGTIHFIFVGTLVQGKNPLYAIQLVEAHYKMGVPVSLTLYGQGTERKRLEDYIGQQQLETIITLKGNHSQEVLKTAYQNSHFVILPSESEGWPKALAEGMFWGCVPIATPVSCVPFMLDAGEQGILLTKNLEKDRLQIEALVKNGSEYNRMCYKASVWSRKYTLDVFEEEIKKLLLLK